jgi:hypothetical protein
VSGMAVLNVVCLLNDFRKNWRSDNDALVTGGNEFLSEFSIFVSDLCEFQYERLRVMQFRVCEFCEFRRKEGRTLLIGVNLITFTHLP